MSFFTELQIRHTDFDELDLSSEKQKILEILKNDGIHEDVYSNLATAFFNGKDSLNVDPIYCFELIEKTADGRFKACAFANQVGSFTLMLLDPSIGLINLF